MMDSTIRKNRNKHQCGHCPKSFFQPNKLKRHIIRTHHTGEKPFTCIVCLKAFTQADNLKLQMRTHIGGRLYECKVCNASFSEFRDSERHERLHTEKVPNDSLSRRFKVKRYFCKWCDRTYKPPFFKYHKCVPNEVQLRIPRSSKCSVCGQEPIDNIKLHMLTHEEYRPYQCSVCQLGFSTFWNWHEHMMEKKCYNRPRTRERKHVA